MEGELIIMGLMMLIGQIILMQMWNMNWFKKENFKIQKSNVLAQNKLTLRQMEKNMGLKPAAKQKKEAAAGGMDQWLKFLPVLQTLDSDQIGSVVDLLTDGEQEYDGLLGLAQGNPDLVKGILGGISGEDKEEDGGAWES